MHRHTHAWKGTLCLLSSPSYTTLDAHTCPELLTHSSHTWVARMHLTPQLLLPGVFWTLWCFSRTVPGVKLRSRSVALPEAVNCVLYNHAVPFPFIPVLPDVSAVTCPVLNKRSANPEKSCQVKKKPSLAYSTRAKLDNTDFKWTCLQPVLWRKGRIVAVKRFPEIRNSLQMKLPTCAHAWHTRIYIKASPLLLFMTFIPTRSNHSEAIHVYKHTHPHITAH